MRLLTYLFAAALLWAVASRGPATPTTAAEPAPSATAKPPPPQRSLVAYPK
jgi:hypothetical protein